MASVCAAVWAATTGKRLTQANGVICPMMTSPHWREWLRDGLKRRSGTTPSHRVLVLILVWMAARNYGCKALLARIKYVLARWARRLQRLLAGTPDHPAARQHGMTLCRRRLQQVRCQSSCLTCAGTGSLRHIEPALQVVGRVRKARSAVAQAVL